MGIIFSSNRRRVGRALAAGLGAPVAFVGIAHLAGCSLVANLGQFDDAVPASATVVGDDGAGNGSAVAIQPDAPASSAHSSMGSSVQPTIDSSSDAAVNPMTDTTASGQPTDSAVDSAPDPDAAIEPDSATDSATEPATDVEASAADAANETAGGPEAGPWCVGHASTINVDCHDFDEGNAAPVGFSTHYYSGNFAAVTSADHAPSSAPSSLLISTPALGDGGTANNQFNDTLSYHSKLELSFAVKIVDYDPNVGNLSVFRLSYKDNKWAETLDLHGATATLTEVWTPSGGGTGQTNHTVTMPSPLDAWTLVDIVVDLGGHTQSMTYNGVSALTGSEISNPADNNPTLFVQSGLNFLIGPAKTMFLYWDDLIVATPP
jgi:hypothetical protein